jgi:hypothetical protein
MADFPSQISTVVPLRSEGTVAFVIGDGNCDVSHRDHQFFEVKRIQESLTSSQVGRAFSKSFLFCCETNRSLSQEQL